MESEREMSDHREKRETEGIEEKEKERRGVCENSMVFSSPQPTLDAALHLNSTQNNTKATHVELFRSRSP